ncbi:MULTISPECIES: N-acetylmuramoyl-L-alanine amidase family protein [unclassified Sedimentibacter]|uniref:N-acetylmuramoyl-L-alanine amidase family protein n=1 Tax=unclassified Sedimentibacter TaxID=2649220 RepID=UPI0027DEB3CA|nr:N-acetylmuramoyl-L-alanine amidase [Sedimentibacter sp. MB35-C1]WMJ77708.1 N-acetylmuramoyl-L-alanine amidase [Sedimentibacter sp. MB35-C1]
MAIKIFVDQGHNPTGHHNTGARGNGLVEEDITYQVGLYLAYLLENDPRFEVMLSRPTPTTVLGYNNTTSLAERVRMANSWPADYFISIHANANENPNINGAEMYIYQYGTQANWLAQNILNAITYYTDLRNNGIRENRSLYVLRRTSMPAVLVEMGYLTNYHDAQIIRDEQWRIAYSIYVGILNYFGFESV